MNFIRGSKHLETIKALGLRLRAFITFSVFGTPDETLALVFHILLQNVKYLKMIAFCSLAVTKLAPWPMSSLLSCGVSPSSWSPDIVLQPTAETMAEAKVNREIFFVVIPKHDALDHMLHNHALPRVLRIGAWVWRFIHNCRNQARTRTMGPISTEEIQHCELNSLHSLALA